MNQRNNEVLEKYKETLIINWHADIGLRQFGPAVTKFSTDPTDPLLNIF